MENAEEVFHFLEEFSKRKPKTIPQELNDYLAYVARTGDPVYQWSLVKCLFKEKLLNVITDFYETTPGVDIPPYPNVDPFNYDIMKNSLLERLDSFTSAPFTVQRICELLTYPRKQYNRVDKFMRAIEKNILVVSTREPGIQRHIEQENGESNEPIVNGSDNNSEYNVDVEMEDVSWKENAVNKNTTEPQPSSSETQISVDSVEKRIQGNVDTPMDMQEKNGNQYETVEQSDSDPSSNSQEIEKKCEETLASETISHSEEPGEVLKTPPSEIKEDVDMKPDVVPNVLVIPEIKIDDAEMTEQKLNAQAHKIVEGSKDESSCNEPEDPKPAIEHPQTLSEDSCSSSNSKEDITETKIISEASTSSEESSSSSDNTDGNSNSPKTDPESQTIQIESSQENSNNKDEIEKAKDNQEECNEPLSPKVAVEKPIQATIQTDNYSISDVNSEIQQIPPQTFIKSDDSKVNDVIANEKTENKTDENVDEQSRDTELPTQ
ncbi:serine/threonine-protein phosphatase 4 regulatory subunit 2-like [Battus philenor]|uniref:serine/threonine-protein phosphatase 4 regulatory subunit 2-like n=1 Tax=Battus philenor TaxID=42288 RepID=UPI0035D04AA6